MSALQNIHDKRYAELTTANQSEAARLDYIDTLRSTIRTGHERLTRQIRNFALAGTAFLLLSADAATAGGRVEIFGLPLANVYVLDRLALVVMAFFATHAQISINYIWIARRHLLSSLRAMYGEKMIEHDMHFPYFGVDAAYVDMRSLAKWGCADDDLRLLRFLDHVETIAFSLMICALPVAAAWVIKRGPEAAWLTWICVLLVAMFTAKSASLAWVRSRKRSTPGSAA